MGKKVRYICLILLFVCAVFWFLAPFIQVDGLAKMSAFKLAKFFASPSNLADHLLSAIQEGNLLLILTLLSVVASGVCILLGLLNALFKSCSGTCTMAILAEIPLLAAIVLSIAGASKHAASGSVSGAPLHGMGIGFWGIFVLMIAVIVVCGCDEVGPDEA